MSDEFISSKDFEKFNKKNDDRLYEYGKRIAALASLIEDNKKIKDDLIVAYAKIDNLSVALYGHIEDIKQSLITNKDSNNQLSQKIDTVNFSLRSLKIDHDQTKSDVYNVITYNNANSNKISELNAQIKDLPAVKESLQVHKLATDTYKNTATSQFSTLNESIAYLTNKVSNIRDEFNKSIEISSEFNKNNDIDKNKLSLSVDNISNAITALRSELLSTIIANTDSLSNTIDSKVSTIKVPDVTNFVTKDRIDSLENQLHLVALDAKNAVLKLSNVDLQNQLTSKKLETTQLLLKQQELNK